MLSVSIPIFQRDAPRELQLPPTDLVSQAIIGRRSQLRLAMTSGITKLLSDRMDTTTTFQKLKALDPFLARRLINLKYGVGKLLPLH